MSFVRDLADAKLEAAENNDHVMWKVIALFESQLVDTADQGTRMRAAEESKTPAKKPAKKSKRK